MEARITKEALEAIAFAVEGKEYRGEFMGGKRRQDDPDSKDIIVYLLHPNPFYIGKHLMTVWLNLEDARHTCYVDVNPDDANMPKSGKLARAVILDFLETNNFSLKVTSDSLWPVWERQTHLVGP